MAETFHLVILVLAAIAIPSCRPTSTTCTPTDYFICVNQSHFSDCILTPGDALHPSPSPQQCPLHHECSAVDAYNPCLARHCDNPDTHYACVNQTHFVDCLVHEDGSTSPSKDSHSCPHFHVCSNVDPTIPCQLPNFSNNLPCREMSSEIKTSSPSRELSAEIKAGFTCSSQGRFPDSSDSTGYFVCTRAFDGGFLQQAYKCPSSSHFNPDTRRCSLLYRSPRSVAAVDTAASREVFACSRVGRFVVASSCESYYTCVKSPAGGFVETLRKCPGGTLFNGKTGRCSDPTLVDCDRQ